MTLKTTPTQDHIKITEILAGPVAWYLVSQIDCRPPAGCFPVYSRSWSNEVWHISNVYPNLEYNKIHLTNIHNYTNGYILHILQKQAVDSHT